MAASFAIRPRSHLHLAANQLVVFNLWIGAPLFAGFLRDWSPLRTGDRGHIDGDLPGHDSAACRITS